ncbi:MAG: DEAD/DEAH box helicase [Caldisphaera sp.]
MMVETEPTWEHQREVIDKAISIINQGKNAFVALPTGSGKSRIALEIANIVRSTNKEAHILIICPRRILIESVWRSEARKWATDIADKVMSLDGRREADTRDTFWNNVSRYNYIVLATPNIINSGFNEGLFDINYFDLIILDEAHHSIKHNGNSYIRSVNYQFLNSYRNRVLGLSIRGKTILKNVEAAAEMLKAELITSDNAKERKLDKIVIKLYNEKRLEIDELTKKEIGRLLAIFMSKFKNFKGFPFSNADAVIRKCGIDPKSNDARFIRSQCSEFYKLMTINRYLDEDNVAYVRDNLLKESNVIYTKIADTLRGYNALKVKECISTTKKEVTEGRPTLIFTQFRNTAYALFELLREAGLKTELLIGGVYPYPEEKLKEFISQKIDVLIATTEMGGEGLNLQYFRTIILLSGIKSNFKQLQLEGRIRGGKLIQLLYLGAREEGYSIINEI